MLSRNTPKIRKQRWLADKTAKSKSSSCVGEPSESIARLLRIAETALEWKSKTYLKSWRDFEVKHNQETTAAPDKASWILT